MKSDCAKNQALAITQRYLVERFHEKYHIDLLHPARSQRCLQFFEIPEKGEAMEGNCVIVERYKLALRTAVFSANVSKLERFVYDHFCLPQRTIVAVPSPAFSNSLICALLIDYAHVPKRIKHLSRLILFPPQERSP